MDYALPEAGASCAPCGAASAPGTLEDLPRLAIRREHRFRDVAYPSSFGPGVFQGYDVSLQLFTTGTGERYADFFTPDNTIATRFFDGAWAGNTFGYSDPADGIYKDLIDNRFRQLRLFDQLGQVTQSHSAAVTVVVESYEGRTWTFQIIDLGGGVRAGRITRIADARDYAIVIAYQYQPGDDLMGSQARLWQIASITDAYGNAATFAYAAAQVAGRWVVEQITLPTGAVVGYQYAGGYLSGVTHPDGTLSSFTYTWDPVSKCTVLGIDDAAAEPTHRRKSVHVTTNFTVGTGPDGVFMPQSAQLVRLVIDGVGEVTYLNIPHPWATASYVYEGGNRLKYVAFDLWDDLVLYARHATTWNIARPNPSLPWTWNDVAVSLEAGFGTLAVSKTDNQKTLYRNEAKWSRDESNRVTTYTGYNESSRFLKRTSPDGTSEYVTYNALQQRTRVIDRLGRVTEQSFDAVGNRLSRTTGSTWDAINQIVVPTADTATETWEYIPIGQPNQHRLAAAIDANGNRTDYAYDSRGRLFTVTGPADVLGGLRPVTTYVYDAASRLTQVIQPVATNTMTFGYDARSRIISVTYADGSARTTTYGTGTNANLVVRRTDRNGNVTARSYDLNGRLVQETKAGPGVSAPVVRLRTWSYLVGTNTVASSTDQGEAVQQTLDYRNRAVATTRFPKVGQPLTEQRPIDSLNRALGTIDAYNRASWNVYDSDNRVIRTVRELIPGALASTVPTDTAARQTYLLGLVRVTSANPGYAIEDVTFDPESQLLSRTDARGIVSSFTYTKRGQPLSQTEATGSPVAATTAFTYDPAGNRLTAIGPRATTAMTYTRRNLLATVTEAAGTPESTLIRSLTYTLNRKTASETDALGRITNFIYGACCDRLQTVIDPAGFQTTFTYDFVGNRTTVTDGNGLTSSTTYDALDRPLTQSNAAAEVTTLQYDDNLTDGVGIDAVPAVQAALVGVGLGVGADGSAVAATNPQGETAYELRDGLGRPVVRLDPLNRQTRMTYDTVVAGLVETAQADALNHVTKARTDGAGRARIQIDALGNQHQTGFAADGEIVSQVDAAGLGWTAIYDERNRMLSRTTTRVDALERMQWTYDLDSNRLTEADALNQVETCQYDLRNRRTACTDRVGAITRFAYDAVSNLVGISDGENESRGAFTNPDGTTQYAYDARNLLIAEAFPTGQAGRTLRRYSYDAGRRLVSRQVGILAGAFSATAVFGGSPEATAYVYDAANRLTTRGYADALNDSFAYDLASRLTSAVSARYGTTVSRSYDADGRLTSESLTLTGSPTDTVSYAYDAANRTTGLTYPNGTQVAHGYTDRNELASVHLDGALVATRTYDVSGRLINTAFGNGVSEARSYLTSSPLVGSIAAAPPVGAAATGFSYSYDAAGRKLAENDSVLPAAGQTFGYDAAGRLIDWKQGPVATPTATQTWNLSLVGDWTSTTRDGVPEARQHSWVHEAVQVGAGLLLYDAKGNLTRDERSVTLAWDPENRLTSAQVPAAASPTGVVLSASYRYDALGRRVAKTVNGAVTRFLHAGAQVVQEDDRVLFVPVAEWFTDGSAANAAALPASGGILPSSSGSPVTRINFQPLTSAVPAGFYADKGRLFGVRTNGLTYGWSASTLSADRVRRSAAAFEEWDTFIRLQRPTSAAKTWNFALPNGTYPVVVVSGDATSRNHTNNLVIEGTAVSDPDPAQAQGYELGDFDGYAVQAVVTDGTLTITVGAGSLDPTLCFVEIGAAVPAGTPMDPAAVVRLNGLVAEMTAKTFAAQAPVVARRQYVWGTYVDELLLFKNGAEKFYTHTNHLYSPAAMTNSAGAVVEKYAYTAYGKRTVLNAVGAVIPKSTIGLQVGFTGRYHDSETGLTFFRTRYESPVIGRFLNRMPWFHMGDLEQSNYTWDVMDEVMADFMEEDLEEDTQGAYLQGRYNLYDFMGQSPANGIEPYSGWVCAGRYAIVGVGVGAKWILKTIRRTPKKAIPPAPKAPQFPKGEDAKKLKEFFGPAKGPKKPNPDKGKDIPSEALDDYKKAAEEAIKKYNRWIEDPSKCGDWPGQIKIQEERIRMINEEIMRRLGK